MSQILAEDLQRQLQIKRHLINEISLRNRTASDEFLEQFSIEQLQDYLNHLTEAQGKQRQSLSAAS